MADTKANANEENLSPEQLITEHLDIWTTAIEQKSSAGRGSSKKFSLHGIKKLRELILELAVRGKLVPQDPNDEPASVLLERIAAEKAQLIKDKKNKKPKALPEISDEEKPFELPNGWVWVRLNEVADYNGRPNLDPKNITDNTWLLDLEDIEKDTSKLIYKAVYSERESKSNKSTFKKGDVLYGKLRPYLNKVVIADDDGVCTTEIVPIVPNEAVNAEYLQYLLKSPSFLNYVNSLMYGVKMPRLGTDDAVKSIHPIAPLEEQHRIVAKVDELMRLCDALEAQTENSISAHQTLVEVLLEALLKAPEQGATPDQATKQFQQNWQRLSEHFDTLFTTNASIDTLKQTILQLAVMGKLVPQNPNDEPAAKLLERIAAEKAQLIKDKKIKKQKPLPKITDDEKPFELPEGWEWINLASIITLMDAGWSPACPPEASPNNDTWGVLKTTAVQSMEYRAYENKTLSETKDPKPQYEVKVGDILITRAGPKNRVGVSCLVQETRPKLMISDKIIRFHLLEVGMSERFISLCLNAGVTAAFLESSKSGMAESQMNISQDKLKAAPIPLAPIKEQQSIITKVDELMALCDQLKARLTDAQTTKLHLTDAIVEQAL